MSRGRSILVGLLSGLFSAAISLVLAYLVGIVATAISTRELMPTILTSFTALPLMVLFVLLLPTLFIAIDVGLCLGISVGVPAVAKRIIGGVSGLVMGFIILSEVLPKIVTPRPGDFTSIVSYPLLSGIYGLVLGVIAGQIFCVIQKASL